MNQRIRFSRLRMAFIIVCLVAFGVGCAGMSGAGAQQAAVSIDPPSGKKGTTITITGTGFKPAEEIDIVLTLGPGERIGLGTTKVDVIVADAQGHFAAESTIPVFAKPGTYKVEIEGSAETVVETMLVILP